MANIDVKPTAEVVRNIGNTLGLYQKRLHNISDAMTRTGDISGAWEAMNAVTNCFNQLRLDLLVSRPIREHQRALAELEQTKPGAGT